MLPDSPPIVHSAGLDEDDEQLSKSFQSLRDALLGANPMATTTGYQRHQPPVRKPLRDPIIMRENIARPAGPDSHDADDAMRMRNLYAAASAAAQAAKRQPHTPRADSFAVPTLAVTAHGRAPNLDSVRRAELLIVRATSGSEREPPELPDDTRRRSVQSVSIRSSKSEARHSRLVQDVRIHAAAAAHRTREAL